jgi:hypothetical protein
MIITDTKAQVEEFGEYLSEDSDEDRDTKHNILDPEENGIEEEEECAECDDCSGVAGHSHNH